jgi:putative SOS response-associated peptidase YedK
MKHHSKMSIIGFVLTLIICLFSASLFAQQAAEIDLNHFLTEKKAIIKENVQLTDQEDRAFWPLYDEYMQTYAELFKRRADLEKGMLEYSEAVSEKRAKIIVDEYYDIVSDSLKAKLSMLKKVRKILPETKVLKFFQLEEKIEAGFQSFTAESQPLVK